MLAVAGLLTGPPWLGQETGHSHREEPPEIRVLRAFGAGLVKRRYRLSDKDRFRLVRQTGRSFAHPLLVLCLLPNATASNRCGFTASRRIGNAVHRNRARRRMSEALRLLWDLIEPGWDMVWIARPGINEVTFSELQSACIRLLRRADVLRNED